VQSVQRLKHHAAEFARRQRSPNQLRFKSEVTDAHASRDGGIFLGIKALEVIVEELREEVPNGLTEQQLQNDVELRLRNAGIAIIPSNQANQGAAPYLYVRVNSIQCRDFSYRPNTIAQ
jgi:hypothetical protein